MSETSPITTLNLQMCKALGLSTDGLLAVDIKIRPARPIEVVATYLQPTVDGVREMAHTLQLVTRTEPTAEQPG